MFTYSLFGTKGGVGTSTAAALMAIGLSLDGYKVVLRSADADILLPTGERYTEREVRYMQDTQFFCGFRDEQADFEIIDCRDFDEFRDHPANERIAVTDGSYASLHKGAAAFELADVVLLVGRLRSALGRDDVETVSHRTVLLSPWSAQVARSGDAGTLQYRRHSMVLADHAAPKAAA